MDCYDDADHSAESTPPANNTDLSSLNKKKDREEKTKKSLTANRAKLVEGHLFIIGKVRKDNRERNRIEYQTS